jgi:hypothetical protein
MPWKLVRTVQVHLHKTHISIITWTKKLTKISTIEHMPYFKRKSPAMNSRHGYVFPSSFEQAAQLAFSA